MRIFLSRKRLLLIVLGAALAVRGVFFCFWHGSAFRFYHRVPGLDMQTLLRFSEWGPGCEFRPLFVVHRILIHLVWLVCGRQHCVEAVVVIQSLLAAAGAVMLADVVLALWGRRGTALCAGLFYALYGPLVLYDFCVLQESVTTTLILSAVWAFVRCRARKYPPRKSFCTGLLLGLCSAGRPVAAALALFLPGRTFLAAPRKRRSALLMAAGVFALWAAASVFNFVLSEYPGPFFHVLPYTVRYNAEKSSARGGEAPVRRLSLGLPGRAAKFLLAFEMPENLNYYFLRHRLTPLKFLPGPGLLLPVALAGLLLMLGRVGHREDVIVFAIVLLALPLAAREPIGRYRLHLVPYFVICAAYFFNVLRRGVLRTNVLCGTSFALALGVNFLFSDPGFIRASDHVAWALAEEQAAGGRITSASLREFAEGWRTGGCADKTCGVNLILRFIRLKDLSSAAKVCAEGISGPAREKSVYRYYLTVILVSFGSFDAASKEFEKIRPEEIPELGPKLNRLRKIVREKHL